MPEEKKQNKNLHATEKITEGKVVEKSKLQKAAALFFDEDIDAIKSSVSADFIKPRMTTFLKEMSVKLRTFIVDTGNEFLQSILFPGSKRPKSGYYNGQQVNYTSYSGYYNSNGESYRYGQQPGSQMTPSNQVKKIRIESFGDAKKILADMQGYIEVYHNASVADYYQLVGVPGNETDFNFGWKDLSNARIYFDSSIGGYTIDFPKVVPLE